MIAHALHIAACVALALLSGGCMPWVVGETAETLPRGDVRVGVGLAALAPPSRPARLLPVPQLGVTAGVADGLDVAFTYVPPLTAHVRARGRLTQSDRWAAAGTLGLGLHGVPDVTGSGTRFGVPFGTAGIQLSTRGSGPPRWYGAVRAVVPAHLETPAMTLWLAPQAGVELGAEAFRWGAEVGAVVPTMHPGQTQLVIGLSGRWHALP